MLVSLFFSSPSSAFVSSVFATDSTLGDKVLTLVDGALTTHPTYFGGSVVVNVWIEGWDADTYDAIFDTQLNVQLGFTTTTVTP